MNKKQLLGGLIIAASIVLFFVLFFTVKHRENSNVINVNVGGNFAITLESNPTTGYSWEIADTLDVLKLGQYSDNLPTTPAYSHWIYRSYLFFDTS